ncbi:protein of unknown function [Maridesulfovibrio hydrothermalis AM13 = DSM 14728]|uniref:Uncharacterized protein n=1 Tax=Maridesulfovibrio hydrothermalis AM13 = DSM 14728 TaxID=1121451 RepID=L0R6Z8_9BACT|nr:protein of unknown function [Maridesulfovibrio hydrothermalis AM13 = DSM 14728]
MGKIADDWIGKPSGEPNENGINEEEGRMKLPSNPVSYSNPDMAISFKEAVL